MMYRVLLLLLCLAALAYAQATGPAPVLVWIDQTTKLTDDAVKTAVDALAAQNPNPQHIVILVHGFDVPRQDSQEAFGTVAGRLQKAYAAVNQTVSVLGVQWDSDADTGVLGTEEAYKAKTLQSRATGRFGFRQILLGVVARFPGVPIDVMGHSMGCELAAAGLRTDMKFDPVTDALGAYQPQSPAPINSLVMCGSDLDYDAAYKGDLSATPMDCKLMWMTISPYLGNSQDRILNLRAMVSGMAAGAVLPKFTEDQWVRVTKAQRALWDNKNIPKNHAYLDYYSDERLGRIVPSVVYKANPKATKITPELQGIADVMAAPNVAILLKPFLDSPLISTQIYAMCRLEELLCGGPKHLSSEYLSDEALKLKDQPKVVRQDCATSPCQLMKQGYWPTEAEFTRAGAPKWAENQ